MNAKPLAAAAWFLCVMTTIIGAVPVAFPGAEGAGRFAVGGRGGAVYEVTNLTNSGPGSIVDAVSQGNRTIVFRVSGTIELGDILLRPKSNTTIAGQTAPGDGICLKGRIYISNVSNIVIRYIRIRVDEGGANSNGDAIDIASGSNIIIDHVSASYARDETISCQPGSNNVTVQWCILSEALTFENHSYGALVRGRYGEKKSYHHNLFIHNKGRNPRPGNYLSAAEDPDGLYFDFRNNVIYNWSGTHPGNNYDTGNLSRYNFINNVYIRGPGSSGTRIFGEYSIVTHGFFSGNAHGTAYWTVNVPSDPWSLVTFSGFTTQQINAYKERTGGAPIPMEPVTTTSALQALDDVLASAGASLVRDVIDTRLVSDVISGTGSYVAYTSDLADPWPTLNSAPAPLDSDHDGMPDAWEIANGLNENNPADRNDYDLHPEYTNLEVYLNSLVADDLEAPGAPVGLAAVAGNAIVALDWDDNGEADLAGYNVYRSTDAESGYIRLNGTAVSNSEYTDDTAQNGTTYFFTVTAVDWSSNESVFSDAVYATPIDLDFYGDTNNDKLIDMTDLPDFLYMWLQSDCLITSGWDINGDCRVNFDEYSLLAALWMLPRPTTPVIIIQENETGFCGVDGPVEDEHAGYTGSGYANTDNALGKGIDYSINILASGTYTFVFRYAGTSSRPADLIIDGNTEVEDIAFPSTTGWTTWNTTAPIEVALTAGMKNVRLEAAGSDGLANIDYMQVSGTNLHPAACP